MNNVAVIMSVYKSDSEEHLKNAIESILLQTIECDLLIYIDGNISEPLSKVIYSYDHLSNIQIFSSSINRGLAFALNFLIERSLEHEYNYIARMDSDDYSYPNRLEKQIKYFKDNENVDVNGTFCKEFGSSFALDEKKLPTFSDDLRSFSIARCPFIHPTVVFRRKIFEKGFRYPVDTDFTEDMALWFELLLAGYSFANVNEVLLDYRVNEATLSRRKGLNKLFSEVRLRFRYMKLLNEITFKNITLIIFRIPFHLMPTFILKIIYQKMR